MAPTIAIIAAGAMGAAVARRFTAAGATVLTNLEGRSESTRRRAHDAGMQDVPFAELARRSSFLLSILPPSEAARLASRYLEAYNSTEASQSDADDPIYVDCNAVSPDTVQRISALFAGSGVRFVDAGIIGGPPREGYDPTFYASADATNTSALDAFDALGAYGMKIATLREDGAGVGDASALKMSYAATAHAASPATSAALMRELHASQPLLLQRLTLGIPSMLPKAYRWVGEMHEISDFVGGPSGDVYKGMASVYERIEHAVAEDGPDKQVLDKFVEDAKKLLEEQKKKGQAADPGFPRGGLSVRNSAIFSTHPSELGRAYGFCLGLPLVPSTFLTGPYDHAFLSDAAVFSDLPTPTPCRKTHFLHQPDPEVMPISSPLPRTNASIIITERNNHRERQSGAVLECAEMRASAEVKLAERRGDREDAGHLRRV
ncbi:hypothetical protein EVG20_g1390 [Dentipellis fragilis]|uniref:6-phosphogluconate dehydrogenase NADP-binding domain-containing protein n=1 Tax=Dentipellis fragilis TaxID=205917 RepID=A0A4Y9ZCP7_9AGAM|nr:hypothetical protein EVG20_g1390 [Dentipellis fragilis]